MCVNTIPRRNETCLKKLLILPGVNIPASSAQGQTVNCSEKSEREKENPRVTSQTLQALVSMLNLKVPDSTRRTEKE